MAQTAVSENMAAGTAALFDLAGEASATRTVVADPLAGRATHTLGLSQLERAFTFRPQAAELEGGSDRDDLDAAGRDVR